MIHLFAVAAYSEEEEPHRGDTELAWIQSEGYIRLVHHIIGSSAKLDQAQYLYS